MNWNDYEAVWKRQELPIGSAADLATLKDTFETKRRKMAAGLWVRDLAEASAGIVASIAFAFTWWKAGKAGWPIGLSIALILGVSCFFVRERVRSRRLRLRDDASLLAKIEADLVELRHQRHLLLNIWSWYLAPLTAAIVIAGATMVHVVIIKAPPGFLSILWEHPAALAWIVLYVTVVLPLCLWGAWAINRRAVRKQIDPRLEELEKLHRELLAAG